jgi:hypothetical protein
MCTDQDRADAIANPRAGDVWGKGTVQRTIVFTYHGALYAVDRENVQPTPGQLRKWTRNATLLRRGA